MIVIAAGREPGVEDFRFAATHGQTVNVAAGIEHKEFAIPRPVRGFDVVGGVINHTTVFGTDGDNFQGAVKDRPGSGGRVLLLESDAGKPGAFKNAVIMRANTE